MPLVIQIRVNPGSGKQLFTLDKTARLRCYLKNQAEKGLANKELCTLLAKALGIAQADIGIIAGATSRTKYIRIPLDMSTSELMVKLGIAVQMKL